jgi:hypothetical protein
VGLPHAVDRWPLQLAGGNGYRVELTAQVGPRVVTAVMITTATRAGNNPYSTALALSSFRKMFDNVPPFRSLRRNTIHGRITGELRWVTINKYAKPRLF